MIELHVPDQRPFTMCTLYRYALYIALTRIIYKITFTKKWD